MNIKPKIHDKTVFSRVSSKLYEYFMKAIHPAKFSEKIREYMLEEVRKDEKLWTSYNSEQTKEGEAGG